MRSQTGFAATLVALLAFAAVARADVDVPLGNGDRVTGTLSPAGEIDTFRVVVPAHAKLAVSAVGKKSKGSKAAPPAVTFRLLDATDQEVAKDRIKASKTGASLKSFDVPATGEYRIVVEGVALATGDFQLAASWKSPTKFSFTGTLAGADQQFVFAAEAGAGTALDVAAAPRAATQPAVKQIDATGFTSSFAAPPAGAKRHKVTAAGLPQTADYTVTVTDAGGAGGAFKLAVAVKPPKATKRAFLLTDAVLGGSPTAGAFVKGAVIGPGGGTFAIGSTAGTTLDGASVAVPAGALGGATSLIVGDGRAIPPPPGSGAAGPTMFCGPEGLTFADGKSATVTLPFDPSRFPGADFSSLKVFTRDASGKVTQVTGVVIDAAAHTVSFPAAHFSSFRVFGPPRKSPFDLNADGIDDLVAPAPGDQINQGAVFVYFGRADFGTNRPTSPDLTFNGAAVADRFGAAFATGDVNGDGTADLVVGAPTSGNGKVFVFFGGATLASRDASGADATLLPRFGDTHFGATVLAADVSGGPEADVIVADDRSLSNGSLDSGAIYVFPGATSFANAVASDAIVIAITGQAADDRFGSSLAAGDVTGDGRADVAIGILQTASSGTGQVRVFPGGASLVSQRVGDLANTSILFTGELALDAFGSSVAAGDLNQDGVADLVVGAPNYDDPIDSLKVDLGRVFVFFGGVSLSGGNALAADRQVSGLANSAGDHLGASVAVGNVFANSTPDLVLAAPGADRSGQDSGDVEMHRGGTDFTVGAEIVGGPGPGALMGILYPPVDVDDDGLAQPVIGMPDLNSGAGRLRVIVGTDLFGREIDFDGTAGQRLGGRD